MDRRVNLIDLKNLLRAELKIRDEKKTRFENALYEKDIYAEIIGYLNTNDIDILHTNLLSLSLLFPLIYDEGKTKFIEQEFYKVIYLIKRTSGNRDLKDEYQSAMNKLKSLINTIMMEYDVLCKKITSYSQQYNIDKKESYDYCGILYKINTGFYITDKQLSVTNDLIKKSGYSHEDEIIFMELLNHHNIRVKFNNPIISYTTIRMVESDFPDYSLTELSKSKKTQFDECANSIFDAIMFEDDHKNNFEITMSVISLMDELEKDYVLKKTMNKFLSFLRECKSNMLEDNSYEDIELRKMIIQEYNSYYYKFKSLEDYYKLINAESLNENQIEIDFEENEEQLSQQEIKNHLFFANGSSRTYVERDIEDIPEEYLPRVKKLLEGFATDTLPEINVESFVSNSLLKGYRKLKEDQIRIVYRKLLSNNYLILGIILKKSDDANKQYTNMIKRDYEYDISTPQKYIEALEESETTYNRLIEYIDNYSRKGNR